VGRDFSHLSRLALGPLLRIKWPKRGIDHPPPSSAKVKERVEWPVLGVNIIFKTSFIVQHLWINRLGGGGEGNLNPNILPPAIIDFSCSTGDRQVGLLNSVIEQKVHLLD